jgi:hypothetical protein
MKKSLNASATPTGGDVKELTLEQLLGSRDWYPSQAEMIKDGFEQLGLDQGTSNPTLKYTSEDDLVNQLAEMFIPEYVNRLQNEVEDWASNLWWGNLDCCSDDQNPLEAFDDLHEAVEELSETLQG